MALTFRTAAVGAALILLSAAGPAGALQSGGRETLAVRDSLGRAVILPGRAVKVLSLQPEITRLVVALGAGERLVGADYFILQHDHLFPIVFPAARDLPAVSNTSEDMNFEMVMRLNPDVVFVSPTELQMVDALQGKLKRPVVAFASMGSFDKLVEEILLVGRILGREARAAELAADFKARLASVRGTLRAIPEEKKPRVFLSFWGTLTRTPVIYEPVDAAGGINCAAGMLPASLGTVATVAQAEQILAWRPDVILVQGSYPPRERAVTTEGILRDKRFGSLPAVRNRRVYYTFGFWYWWDPALVLVETLYLAHLFHPDAMGPLDLEKEANAIFKKYYGIEGAYTSLCRALECGEWDEK
jgi:iron complex transport system substrate-binding protein